MKSIYLTIDDAPSANFMDKCYLLKEHKIPAVFFCIGKNLEKEYQTAVQAVKLGFPIGNHSYSHPRFSSISLGKAAQEIFHTDELIGSIYKEAGIEWQEKWFRFPYGDKGDGTHGKHYSFFTFSNYSRSASIQQNLKELGYSAPKLKKISYSYFNSKRYKHDVDWQWTFDIMEWQINSSDDVQALNKALKRIVSRNPKDIRRPLTFDRRWLCSNSDEIVLLHDHEKTFFCFEEIIKTLLSQELQFKLP